MSVRPDRKSLILTGNLAAGSAFPPPWSVEELNACFVVKNSAGQKLAYVYYEEEPGQAVDGEVAHEDELSGAFLFGRAISALVIFAPSKFCEWPTWLRFQRRGRTQGPQA